MSIEGGGLELSHALATTNGVGGAIPTRKDKVRQTMRVGL